MPTLSVIFRQLGRASSYQNLEANSQWLAMACSLMALMVALFVASVYGWFAADDTEALWHMVVLFSLNAAWPGMALFALNYRHNPFRWQTEYVRWRKWVHWASLIMACGFFYAALGSLVSFFIQRAFVGWQPETVAVGLIAAGLGFISSYTARRFAQGVAGSNIMQIMVAILAVGVGGSMLLNDKADWWRHNFSYLGSLESNTHLIFNATLVIAGLLFWVAVDYLFHELQHVKAKQDVQKYSLRWARYLFTGVALSLIMMGIVPNVPGEWLGFWHNFAAKLLVAIIMMVVIGCRWILPGFGWAFYSLSYLLAATIVILYVVFFAMLHLLNVTTFELLSFMACVGWLYVFMQTITARVMDLSGMKLARQERV